MFSWPCGLSLVAENRGHSSLRSWASLCSVLPSYCDGFSRWGAQALSAWVSVVAAHGPSSCGALGLVAPQQVKSSQTSNCIGRWIPSTGLLCPWDSPGKNTRVGCHALLQGIFPTQVQNPGLWHWRWIPYHLSPQGSPLSTAPPGKS